MRRRARGFTLLEVVIATIVFALLVGALAPVAAGALRRERNRATLARLDALADAIRAHHADTKRAPPAPLPTSGDPYGESRAGLRALLSSTVPGWRGPYVDPGTVEGNGNLLEWYRFDAWNTEVFCRWKLPAGGITYVPWPLDGRPHGLALELISAGEDRTFQTPPGGALAGDDLVMNVNLTDQDRVWRLEETARELDLINGAVAVYRRDINGAPPPSPAIVALYGVGLLRANSAGALACLTDAWGAAYVMELNPASPRYGQYLSPNVR